MSTCRASEAPPRRQAVPASLPAAAGAAARILLVDDDEEVRDTTAATLERLGYVVNQVASAAAAMRVLTAGGAVDVLLTDVAMPGVSGPELARQALGMRPGLPVVFISGFAELEHLMGGDRPPRLVRKPFRAATLAAQIEGALAEASTTP